jgi:hypothetical protein
MDLNQVGERKMGMVSPNDLQKAAIAMMLEGREPKTDEDWAKCVNFWAANIAKGLEESACHLLKRLFDCPLPDEDIEIIAKFQANKKK